jgi:peroxiredoxin
MSKFSSISWRLLPALFVLVASRAQTAEMTAASSGHTPAAGMLHLSDGSFVSGQLADSADPGILRWQAPLFARPLDFAMKGVDAVTFPAPDKLPRSSGEYCFELSGGDVLFGSLVSLNDVEAVLDVPSAGRLHVRRDAIRQFFRWKDGAGLVYQGPNGLDEWTVSPARDAWKHERGQLWTDTPRSFIHGNFELPMRAAIDFEISWTDKPDFVLALGMGRDDATLGQAYHVESWLTDVVIVRETAREAEIASLEKLNAEVHRARFVVYIDREKGRCLAYSTGGKLLANFQLIEKNQAPLTGVRLMNRKGNLRLERLQVSQWSGAAPREDVALDKPRVHLTDGTIQYGELASYDAAAKSFTLRGSAKTARPADQIESLFLGQSLGPPQQPLCIGYQDSTRVSGRLLKIENGTIWLESPCVREPLQLPVAGLRSLVVNGAASGPLETPDGVRMGILEAEGVRLPGFLVDGIRQKEASCIVWNPRGSGTASPVRANADGKIVYHEPPPPPPVRREQPRSRGVGRRVVVHNNNGVIVRQLIDNPLESVQQEPSHELTRKALYLTTGDTIPCEVTRIDQNGLSFKSPISDSTFVPHEKIKAVELTLDGRGPVALTRTKRDRLLTLPRLQKGNPPTHLVRSRDGDYLRGRIVEMDDKRLVMEVRMQTQEIPRERISRIIWLHPDELDESGHPAKPPAVTAIAAATRVQAQLDDGNRLTFSPDRVKDSTLSGAGDAIGLCRVALDKVDQLLFGSAINEAATRAAYQQWKLQYAIEPKIAQEDNDKSSGGAAAGTDSMLVGKAAPEFELEMMGGERFRLSEHKGKIVVLDFWATWCSHCLQSMPELVRLHSEAAGRDVEVIAVNLEESRDAIAAMLDRHKWKIPVALDRDGVVAARYGVTAIPQTVVIGRDGSVARHFIGGGSNVAKNLADSVRGLSSGVAPAAAKAPAKNQ